MSSSKSWISNTAKPLDRALLKDSTGYFPSKCVRFFGSSQWEGLSKKHQRHCYTKPLVILSLSQKHVRPFSKEILCGICDLDVVWDIDGTSVSFFSDKWPESCMPCR